jgi:putative tryptophan/tyrosine transport system substrate-binding protein
MRRREFIAFAGAAALPLAARAQQAMPVVGLLIGGSQEADTFRIEAFRQGLTETGYVEGRNVVFEYRWAGNQYERLPAQMTELIGRHVAVIVAVGNAAARAAHAANSAAPIVFQLGDDPVALGLVESLARPGGHITGVTFLGGVLAPKLFEVLQETVPRATIVGLLENPSNPNADRVRREVQAAAAAFGKHLVIAKAAVPADIEPAFAAIVRDRVAALLIRSDVLFNGRAAQLAELAARHRLPAIHPLREFAAAGGLMSYGASLREAMRQTGVYAGRVLKGEKPADLPVQQSAKVELIVNLKSAKALGLDLPQNLLARADEVIE